MGQIKQTENSFIGSNTDLLHSITKFSAAFSYSKAITIDGKLTKLIFWEYRKFLSKPGKTGAALTTTRGSPVDNRPSIDVTHDM